jgi:hypothetical protein
MDEGNEKQNGSKQHELNGEAGNHGAGKFIRFTDGSRSAKEENANWAMSAAQKASE